MAVTVAEGLLTPDAEGKAAVLTVEYPEGDDVNFYLKNADGKYVTSAQSGNGMYLLEEPNDYSLWYLQVLDETSGNVGIRNTNANFNGNKNQALEYYSGFTTYGWKDNNAAYVFQLYVYGPIETAPAPTPDPNPDPDPEPTDVYELSAELATGDQVVIYNAGNGKAVKSEMSGYYVAGSDVTVAESKITDPAAELIWTVTVNEDGTCTFRQGDKVLAAGQTVKDADAGTYYNNLYLTEADHTVNWTLETCSEANSSYTLYADALVSQYGHVYLEWYGNKTAFSAYDTSADRVTEANFGFQFYVKN